MYLKYLQMLNLPRTHCSLVCWWFLLS